MEKTDKELDKRLRFSEQKRMRLKALLTRDAPSENTFLWSIVDLMTLLLIFFIFIYSQNTDSFLKSPIEKVRLSVKAPPSGEQTLSPKPVPTKQHVREDSRKILNALAADLIKEDGKSETNAPPRKNIPLEEAPANESMAQLKNEAMAVIDENDKKTFSIRWNERRLVFVLGEQVTFPAGQAKLLPESQPLLEKISQVIASKKDFKILVSGHTDDTPIDTYLFPSNWELSAARAISVARFLCRNGVDPHRLSIQGYAEFCPIHPNSTPENRQANRRVEITLIKQEPRESEHRYDPELKM